MFKLQITGVDDSGTTSYYHEVDLLPENKSLLASITRAFKQTEGYVGGDVHETYKGLLTDEEIDQYFLHFHPYYNGDEDVTIESITSIKINVFGKISELL